MIFTEHLTDDTSGLLVSRVGADAHVIHGIQNAPLDGFHAVARIRQGARHDDAHGVIEVRLLHLAVNVYFAYKAEFHNHSKFFLTSRVEEQGT